MQAHIGNNSSNGISANGDSGSGGRSRRPRNFAAAAGRWSAAHRKTAILGWFVFVVLAVVAGGQVGQKNTGPSDFYHGESGRADKTIASHFPEDLAQDMVIVQSDELKFGDPRFDRAVKDIVTRIEQVPSVVDVRSPLTRDGPVGKDGHAALVQFAVSGDKEDAADKVAPVKERVDAARKANPQVRIGLTGDASIADELNGAFSDDLSRAGRLSVPVTLGILVLAFGAFLAAGIPVLLAITGVMATIGLVALLSQISPVDQAIAEVILLIGMAVGVDYSLFYIKRVREEHAAGRPTRAALEAAAATSGRAVLVSGFTVIAAMAGMLMAGDATFISFGYGTMLVVAVAMIGSLTVLPAMLSLLGERVTKGRVPVVARIRLRREASGRGGVWSAIVDRVVRRPVVTGVVAAAVLVAMSVPALELKTQQTSVDDFPRYLTTIKAYKQAQAAFPSENIPAIVVASGENVRTTEVKAAIDRFSKRADADPAAYAPDSVTFSDDGRAVQISVPLANSTDQESAERATKRLRDVIVPATLGKVDGIETAVTGMAAQSIDFNELMGERVPIVFAFVLGLAFLLLMATFRSVVIPIKAIALNLLSVGAAYGVLVMVFQYGWGDELLGVEATGSVAPWLPLFLFVILFGLSMDYHVFILSRVRELVDRGLSTERAVATGIKQTAGVVTSAAAVMVAVFAIFGSLSMLPLKQMGVGLAVAVLIDATIIRAVLLPASMKLLGEWNWYLPKWLEWLPSVGAHGEPSVEVAAAMFPHTVAARRRGSEEVEGAVS